MSIYGRIAQTGYRHRHGAGNHFRHDPVRGAELPGQQVHSYPSGCRIPSHPVFHPGYRRYRTVHRNGDPQNQPDAVSAAGYIPAINHN